MVVEEGVVGREGPRIVGIPILGAVGRFRGFLAVLKRVWGGEKGVPVSAKLAENALLTEVRFFFSELLICSCEKGRGHDI